MNFVEHVLEPKRLLLVWQGPEGSSRVRHTVAELVRDSDDQVPCFSSITAMACAVSKVGFPWPPLSV